MAPFASSVCSLWGDFQAGRAGVEIPGVGHGDQDEGHAHVEGDPRTERIPENASDDGDRHPEDVVDRGASGKRG